MVLQNLGFHGANVLLSPYLQAWSWNGSPSTERQDYLHSVFQIRKKALGHEGNTITSYLPADINNFSMNSPGTRKNSSLLKEIANLTHRERNTFKEINKVWYPTFSPIQISKNQSKKKLNKTKINKQTKVRKQNTVFKLIPCQFCVRRINSFHDRTNTRVMKSWTKHVKIWFKPW